MLTSLRHLFWRHERRLIVAYVAAVGLGVLGLSVSPVRAALLDKAEAAAMRWDGRWVARVDEGVRLAEAGRHREAAEHLAALDAEFPARVAKHRYDAERKRLLRALGASHAALGDSAAALGAYRRLVLFDPRDYLSSVQLAGAAARFGGMAEAESQWKAALAINPTHLPTLRALAGRLSAEGRTAELTAAFDAYADALLLQHVKVSLGDTSLYVDVPVDGRTHDVEVALPRPAGSSGALAIEPGGFAAEIGDVSLAAPMRAGEPAAEPVRVAASVGGDSALRAGLPAQPAGIASLRFRVRLAKPMDAALWALAERAYAGRGAAARAEQVRATLDIRRDAAAADKVTVDVSL